MIGKKRQERLWKHLMEVEAQVGSPLRTIPRWSTEDCPIANFHPDFDMKGNWLVAIGFRLHYSSQEFYQCAYDEEDSIWWHRLSPRAMKEVVKWLERKLAERATNDETA